MVRLMVSVEQIHKHPLDLDLDIDPLHFQLEDEQFRFTSPITGHLHFRLVGHQIQGTGRVKTPVEGSCVRCLAPAVFPLEIPVNEFWMHQSEMGRRDPKHNPDALTLVHTFTGEEIDLTEPLRELIMTELPERPYCSPECKGICPDCGVNLNQESCHCDALTVQQRAESKLPEWKKALKDLKLSGSPSAGAE